MPELESVHYSSRERVVTISVENGISRADWRQSARRALFGQLVLILAGASLAISISGSVALAVLLGGAVSWLPNAWFGFRTMLVVDREPETRLRQLYVAEAIKLLMLAVLFALVFGAIVVASPAIVLGSFVAAHLFYLILLIVFYASQTESIEE